MALYIKDLETGVVHVKRPSMRGDELTFCERTPDGDPATDGFVGGFCLDKASTCPDCEKAIARWREAVRGVRFRIGRG